MSGNASAEEVQEVEQLIDDGVKASANEAGLDVTEIVEQTLAEYADYGAQTQARFAQSAIQQRVDAQSATSTKGILCGSRDRYGKNWPRRYALVRSNGEHIEASSWDSSIPTADGQEVQIPSGAAVQIRLEHDAEYDSYEAKQLDSATQLDHADLANRLGSVAVTPGELSRDDEYETVVVRGEIAYVNPQTVFEDGEPQGDGPVMLEDERGQPKPHFEVVLEQSGSTRVRGHAERQRYAEPFFQVEDFEMLTRDAHSGFDTPNDQAGFLMDALRGREVVLVGNMNSYSQSRRDDGSTVNYVDIGIAGMVEIPSNTSPASGVSDPTASTDDAPAAAPDEAVDDAADDDDAGDSPTQSQIESVEEDIKTYADLVGLSPEDLSVDVIQENTQIDAPESVIGNVITRMKEGGPSLSDATTTATADETPDDPVEACYDDETGNYACPADGCLFKASGQAGLFGHVVGTHITSDDDPEEWIAGQVGE